MASQNRVLMTLFVVLLVSCNGKNKSGQNTALNPVAPLNPYEQVDERYNQDMDRVVLQPGQILTEVAITSPIGERDFQSQVTNITCANSMDDGIQSQRKGLMLLPGSRVLLFRDLQADFDQGIMDAQKKPMLLIICGPSARDSGLRVANMVDLRQIPINTFISETPLLSNERMPRQNFSRDVAFSCVNQLEEAVQSSSNGFILMSGSKVIIVRDGSRRGNERNSDRRFVIDVAELRCQN